MIRLFGTDGIRGAAGDAPLDARTMRALGVALARVLAKDLAHAGRFVVGCDTRESGPSIRAALASGLLAAGARVRSAGVLPTPGVSFLARSDDFDAGIVISASHNPWHDNGVKIFSAQGTKLPDAVELRVEDALAAARDEELEDTRDRQVARASGAGACPADEPALAQRYADWLVARAIASHGPSPLAGLFVVADCANGAASGLARDVFARLGARIEVLSDAPDGRNINDGCGSLHLGTLEAEVARRGADLGVAFDGDADRALFVTERGEAVDGDQVLLIATDALRARGRLRGTSIVGTVMSNLGLERALAARGLGLVREKVGDRHVLARLQQDGGNLGGEPSGHVIFLDEAPTGDGLLTALEVAAAMKQAGKPLSELAALMTRAPQVLRNVRVVARAPLEGIDGHAALVSLWEARLGDRGRVLVRYSGTEPLVRVMAEGVDAALVEDCVAQIAGNLARVLGAP
jgi:phosphoglucosamine mutase